MYALILFLLSASFLTAFPKKLVNRYTTPKLAELPDAIDSGLITNYQFINIPSLPYAYNPAYIHNENSNFGTLIVRVDGSKQLLSENRRLRKSFLYSLKINDQLQPLTLPKILSVDNEFAEDPRALKVNGTNTVIFNENPNIETYNRHMVLVNTDKKMNVLKKNILNYQNTKVEKNWTPFIDNSTKNLSFIYSLLPFSVIQFDKSYTSLSSQTNKIRFNKLKLWEDFWGTPRGGTPAISIGSEQLAFFHSSYFDKSVKKRWFFIGAILFKGDPPYTPIKISPVPIFSKQLYVSQRSITAPKKKLVLYPSGMHFLDKTGTLRLFCGVNDSKILAIDLNLDLLLSFLESI